MDEHMVVTMEMIVRVQECTSTPGGHGLSNVLFVPIERFSG